jgi:hypothetical protein
MIDKSVNQILDNFAIILAVELGATFKHILKVAI